MPGRGFGADPRDLVIQYRRLSGIEACFRTNKHDLRIRAHIAICCMAFCCLLHLRHGMSPDRIRLALNEVEISALNERNGKRKFGMPS